MQALRNFDGRVNLKDAALASGMAFLTGELEKLDPVIRKPLSSETYARDIMLQPGGGWVDLISNFNIDYAVSGGNAGGVNGVANSIRRMQANFSKDYSKTKDFVESFSIKWVDMQKQKLTGRDLETLLQDGIMKSWGKQMEQATYLGFSEYGTTGLLNNPNITPVAVAATGTGGATTWASKTQEQILEDINEAINAAWAAAQYDVAAIPNHILIDPTNFARLVKPLAVGGTPLAVSMMSYIKENNVAKAQGVDLNIYPCRFNINAGVGGVNRLLAYRNEEYFVNLPVPQELSRIQTILTPDLAYDTFYAGVIGSVRIHYIEPFVYRDGI